MASMPEKSAWDSSSIATRANDGIRVAELSSAIGSLGAALSPNDHDARRALLKQARSLVQALETPRETMIKHCWAQPAVSFAIVAGIESGLFDFMAQNPGVQKVEQIAAALGFDPDLLARLMRHLGSMGYLKEVGSDEYEATNFSTSLSLPIISGGYPCLVVGSWPTFSNFPVYLKEHGWKVPEDPRYGPLQAVVGRDSNFFQHMMTRYPGGEFQNHMAGYRQGRPSWMDNGFYPVAERLIEGAGSSPDADDGAAGSVPIPAPAFLVDIGGGIGHDLDEFCRKHPAAPGRHVLQDLEHVIAQARGIDPQIETMVYDFRTEQPVQGARAYYMHSVLHDWNDEECGRILARVTAAMKPGYSKLLVNENVLPPTGADWETTALDMMMLTLFSSRERTEEHWRRVLEPAGLKIVKIWSKGAGVESLIECELA